MKLRHTFAALAAASVLTALTVTAAESVSVRLQKAIFAEETEGNLEAAIQIYREIVKQGDANRAVLAQAHYRLGLCESKRGKKDEAIGAFRKVIDQFPGTGDVAARSRERLLELGQPAEAIILRQVLAPLGDLAIAPSRVSTDGQLLSYLDWRTGDLWLRNLKDGASQKLTHAAEWTNSGAHAMYSAFSPDGMRIAYDWWNQTNDCYELRVLDRGERISKILGAGTNRWLFTGDWSPDGAKIAAIDWTRADRQASEWQGAISLLTVADGTAHKLVSVDASDVTFMRFSPDGRYLAYHLQQTAPSSRSARPTNDIFIVTLENGQAMRAVEFLANERLAGWAPDGSELLFVSDRRGTSDLWAVRVENGAVQGQPRLVKADLGDVQPIELTRDGAFYYNSEVGNWTELYTASVDFQAGRVITAPRLLHTIFQPQRMVSSKVVSSADQRLLFYCSGNKDAAAYVLDVQSGERQEIQNSGTWASQIGWWWPSPDGASLLVALYGGENEGGLFRVNPQTGEKSAFALHKPGVSQVVDNPIEFHFDENFVAYGRLYAQSNRFVLVKHDLQLDRETEYTIPGLSGSGTRGLYRTRHQLLSDGRTFLFTREDAAGKSFTLVHHDLVTGKQQEMFVSPSRLGVVKGPVNRIFIVTQDDRNRFVFRLFTFEDSALRQTDQVIIPEDFEYRGQDWTEPHLLLIRKEDLEKQGLAERWTLSVQTGELKRTGFFAPSDQFLGLAAKGGRPFIFSATRPGFREIWTMEKFLPHSASSR